MVFFMNSSSPSQPRSPARRQFLRTLLLGGVGVGLLGGSGIAQSYGLEVTRHQRSLPGLRRSLTVAFLTDMHYGPFIHLGRLRQWVEAANTLRPDLMLLGGDQLDTALKEVPSEVVQVLGRLQAPLGVYGVWGNHDYSSFGQEQPQDQRPEWQRRREEIRQAFQESGVHLLRNQGLALRDDFFLAGIDDLIRGQPDIPAALEGAGQLATLLVSHNPDVLPALPSGIGLTLCGHTHGGQVRFPFIGAPVVPSRYGQRYAMGWVADAHGNPAYVSRGLGLTGVPVRNLCTPEITFLTLTPGSSIT